MDATEVADAEHLYRSVHDDERLHQTDRAGRLTHLSASAFNDVGKKPSVDRAAMRESPEQSKKGPDQGIVTLVAGEVRVIKKVQQLDAKQNVVQAHVIDVIHRPEVDNHSHSQIEAAPSIANDATFRRLRERLAQMAEIRGWTLQPKSARST